MKQTDYTAESKAVIAYLTGKKDYVRSEKIYPVIGQAIGINLKKRTGTRVVQKTVQYIRQNGIAPIVGCEKGYKIAESAAEVADFSERYRATAVDYFKTAIAMNQMATTIFGGQMALIHSNGDLVGQ
jgi:hypothetical protein